MYDTQEYAESRLLGTFVRHKGEVVEVVGVSGDLKCMVSTSDSEFVVPLEDLNLESMPLGYSNLNGVATYLSRIPMRRDWRQGVRAANIEGLIGGLRESLGGLGPHPSFKEALQLTRTGGATSVAFSEWFKVCRYGEVVYKDRFTVGEVVGDKVVLTERFKHLKELLNESL